MDVEKNRERIINGMVEVFAKYGFKFTMDNLSKEISMSKKTIYIIYDDKEEIFDETIAYCFDMIKKCKEEILKDESLDDVEKLRRMMIAMPDNMKKIDWRQIGKYKDVYKNQYGLIQKNLRSGWEDTFKLYDKCVEEGKIRKIPHALFKTIFEAGIDGFFTSEDLIKDGISYEEAMEEFSKVLFNGITNK